MTLHQKNTLTSKVIDDNYTLYRHSKSSMGMTPDKEHPNSSTAAISTSQTDNEAVLRKIPRKPEYEGSE